MEVNINTDYIKLDQLIKFSGLASSGTEAKYYILEGMVRVNGEVETRRGRKIRKGYKITFEGQEINVC